MYIFASEIPRMTMSAVSVIIPVHNTAPYLWKCVSSVIGQTLRDIEIIIVENCSDDGSYGLCDEIAKRDSRIRVMHLDKADLAYARNEGIKAASSPYVGFVDSDDSIAPDMFMSLSEAAERNDADICFCDFVHVAPDGSCISPADGFSGEISVLTPAETIYGIFTEKISSSACTKIFRKSLFDSFSFPEDRFFEDHDAVYRMVSACRRCVHVDSPYYFYLQRSDSICHNDTPLRRYHYFLADYGRVGFIKESGLFSPEQEAFLLDRQLKLCINHFRCFRSLPGLSDAETEMEDMRLKIIDIARGEKMSFRDWKLYVGIRYFWPLYVLRYKNASGRSVQ